MNKSNIAFLFFVGLALIVLNSFAVLTIMLAIQEPTYSNALLATTSVVAVVFGDIVIVGSIASDLKERS